MTLTQALMLDDEQSYTKAQSRISQSNTSIGSDVTARMLRYSLYTLGFSYRFISKNLNISEAGLKTLVQEVHKKGIIRLLDKRKVEISSASSDTTKQPIPEGIGGTIETSETEEYNEFHFNAPFSIKLKKTDKLGKKVLTSILVDAGALKQIDAAKTLNCNRLAVNSNCKKYKTEGAEGLIDKRIGQRSDYKITSEVTYDIIKEYLSSVFNDVAPSIKIVTEQLNKNGSDIFSEKAIAIHMKKLGLIDNKKEFISEITKCVNARVDTLEYLTANNKDSEEQKNGFEILKKFKKGLADCCTYSKTAQNLFHIENNIAKFHAELHASVLETIIEKIRRDYIECPSCHSIDITEIAKRKKNNHKQIKTCSGALLSLNKKFYGMFKCNNCKNEFDFMKEILSFNNEGNNTPLAQKKICSANRAGSYENAAKNLKELINLDINRNQVQEISCQVGKYIENEFCELLKTVSQRQSQNIIQKKHPLVKELKIDRRYLDKSKYLICVAADGGRMQMFKWIPLEEEGLKRKKKFYWHENKVFRISIYDKQILHEIENDSNSVTKKKKYQSMKIISNLTTYAATNEKWKDSVGLVESHLYMRGIKPADVQLCLSDGSEHIEREIFEPLFPKATHILDYYHKTEALHECMKISGKNETKMAKDLQDYLWEGEIDLLLKSLKKIQSEIGLPKVGKKRNPEDPKVKFDCFINHIEKNSHRLQYQEYKKRRYPIGSGSIESAVKLFGKRIKGTEKQWGDKGAEAILHLYSFLLSEDNRWEKLWQVQTPWI